MIVKSKVLRLLLLVILIGLISCSTIPKEKIVYSSRCESVTYAKVTFEALITSPNEFNEKFIEIEGFYISGFEKSALFKGRKDANLSRTLWLEFGELDSLRNSTTGNSLFSSQTEFKQIDKKRLRVRGVFDLKNTGHLGEYFGAIRDICYLQVL